MPDETPDITDETVAPEAPAEEAEVEVDSPEVGEAEPLIEEENSVSQPTVLTQGSGGLSPEAPVVNQ